MYVKNKICFIAVVSFIAFLGGCSDNVATVSPNPTTDQTVEMLTDLRDGQSYKIVSIGTQVWMAQNLNYQDGRGTCYNESVGNCDRYGRLYSWYAAIEACPDGWHLPSFDEWNVLFTTVGGKNIAGIVLKSQSGWGIGGGLDSYGFSALPAGLQRGGNDKYFGLESFAYFWSSTSYGQDLAYGIRLLSGCDAAEMGAENLCAYYKGDGDDWRSAAYSVRCVKNLVQENIPQTEQSVQLGNADAQNCPFGRLADGTCNNGLLSNWNEYVNGTAKEVEEGPGYVTDLRWGRNKTYRTVTIGSQVWMAEDVDVSGNCGVSGYWSYLGRLCEPEDGVCEESWGAISDYNTGFYVCSANIINCKLAFSQSIQGACPVGWHIPKESEWLVLTQSFRDSSINDCCGGSLDFLNKSKLAQAGFPMNFCGNGGNRSTYFWTSSLALEPSEEDCFLYHSDGSVFNMRMRIVQFSEALGLTMIRETIENVVSSSTDVSSPFHREYKARLRCVKD